MCTLDPNYKKEVINPKNCDELCEQIEKFLKPLSSQERQKMGIQLIKSIVNNTTFGVENRIALRELFNSILDNLYPP